jgi:transcription antitermination factor NusA-like protein
MAEVPLLRRGALEIVNVARRPGVQSKVAVRPGPAAEHALLSIGGDDIARVRRGLDGEHIQIVNWRREPRRYIAAALGLAEPPPMLLMPSISHVYVYVGEIDLRGLDGWRGVNRLLASALTGWRIRLVSIASTPAWRVLRSAMAEGRSVSAFVLGPSPRGLRVEVEGLYADLRRPQSLDRDAVDVRILSMNADEGRIVVTDQPRRSAQLELPIQSA